MVSVAQNSVRCVGSKFAQCDEPLIDVIAESGSRDPLLIDEIKVSESRDMLLNCSRFDALRTWSNGTSNNAKRIKVLHQLPLQSMVHEALNTKSSSKGIRPRDIKKYIDNKYGINFDTVKIVQAMQAGLESGKIMQIKHNRTKMPIARYRLSKFSCRRINNETVSTRKCEPSESLENSMSFYITDVKSVHESVFNDDKITESGGACKPINQTVSVVKETAEMKSNILGLESKVQKANGGTVHTNEIDFMVLHALCSSPNPSGILLDEIAEFIQSFYDIDAQRSLPCIIKYLNYSIEKGVLFKNGERYKRPPDTRKLDSKVYSPREVKCEGADNEPESKMAMGSKNFYFVPQVKLELEEAGIGSSTKLVQDCRILETNINNNVIQSIDERREAAKVMLHKYNVKRNNFFSKQLVSTPGTMGHELNKYIIPHQILPAPNRSEQLSNSSVTLPHYDEVGEQCIKLAPLETIEEAPIRLIRGKVIPVASEIVKSAAGKQEGKKKNIRKSNALMKQTLKCNKEHSVLQMQNTHQNNLTVKPLLDLRERSILASCAVTDISMSMSEHAITSSLDRTREKKTESSSLCILDEPRYSLAELGEYIYRYPKTVSNNSAASMQNLSWNQVAMIDTVSCIKLTGNSASSDENLNCKICGLQLKFGPLYCSACSFEMDSFIQKCNICHLICNRGDVFHLHFIWEHSPSIQGVDYAFSSVPNQNVRKLLTKLAYNNTFHCRLCTYSTHSVQSFQLHMIVNHTSRMNVFPPLPEVAVPDAVVILQNEITKTCCHKCNKCGFISNRSDIMMYHILDTHLLLDNELYEEPAPVIYFQPKRKAQKKNVSYCSGLCEICGKFYQNVLKHVANANNHAQNEDESLSIIKKRSLPLDDGGISKKFILQKKRRAESKLKTVLCHICGKMVNRRLCEHLRSHTDVMHECSVCGRQFNRQSNLLTHKRVHTREKPFQCDICLMMFGYKCSIKGHIENVHSETVR